MFVISIQTGERSLDQIQIRGETLPKEDEWQWNTGGGREEIPAVDSEEVPPTQQLCTGSQQSPPEIPSLRTGHSFTCQPVCRSALK